MGVSTSEGVMGVSTSEDARGGAENEALIDAFISSTSSANIVDVSVGLVVDVDDVEGGGLDGDEGLELNLGDQGDLELVEDGLWVDEMLGREDVDEVDIGWLGFFHFLRVGEYSRFHVGRHKEVRRKRLAFSVTFY